MQAKGQDPIPAPAFQWEIMAQQGQKVADKQEQIRTTGKMTPRDDWSWVIRSFCFTPCCMSNQHLEKNVIGNIQILSCSRILSSKGLFLHKCAVMGLAGLFSDFSKCVWNK